MTAKARFLIEAMRCWRRAKDDGRAVQPSLYAQLSGQGHEMLAPVIDSLMCLFEAVLGRRVKVGEDDGRPGGGMSGDALSSDENLLLSLLGRSRAGWEALRGSRDLALTFDHALRSTRL